jgi:hypothetical protein
MPRLNPRANTWWEFIWSSEKRVRRVRMANPAKAIRRFARTGTWKIRRMREAFEG